MDAHALRKQGWTISAIARHLGRDRKTVRAYLNGNRVAGERVSASPDAFEPYAVYCAARLSEDPHLWASALFDEVTALTQTITRDELKAGLAAGTITAVDARPESYYAQQHIPGALNLVSDDVPTRATDLLPDRDATIVTYCSNTACGNSGHVAIALTKLGYTNVRKYAEGIQDWVQAGLPSESSIPARQ